MSVFALGVVRREARLIIALVIVAAALFTVVHLGSEIGEDGTSGFDRWLILALRRPGELGQPIGPTWLRPIFIDITALGGVTALTLLTLTAIGFLIAARRYATAALVAAATTTGSLVGEILKFSFARARPMLVPHFVEVDTLSYPSGHAVNSAVVFLTLGALLARAEPVLRTRIYIVTVAILSTLLIGCSRVYVGVHWPTDVMAGWAVGGSWALLWLAIAARVQPKT